MIFVIMGKSATGKDTIFNELRKNSDLGLNMVVPYTTRPIRAGEENAREYYFVEEQKLWDLERENKIVEHRVYQTIHGDWHYFTADDGQIQRDKGKYLIITTLEAYEQIRHYYGEDQVVPLYLEVNDFVRLERSLKRETEQNKPSCAEVCRRFLADENDFAEEKLKQAGIHKRYPNDNIETCCQTIAQTIKNTR